MCVGEKQVDKNRAHKQFMSVVRVHLSPPNTSLMLMRLECIWGSPRASKDANRQAFIENRIKRKRNETQIVEERLFKRLDGLSVKWEENNSPLDDAKHRLVERKCKKRRSFQTQPKTIICEAQAKKQELVVSF